VKKNNIFVILTLTRKVKTGRLGK